MRRLIALSLTVLAMCVVAGVVRTAVAQACDTSYWTVGCQYYSSAEGHTVSQACCGAQFTIYSTFDTYTYLKYIVTTSGGSWVSADVETSGIWLHLYSNTTTNKLGCYNHNGGTMWVNCREYAGWNTP